MKTPPVLYPSSLGRIQPTTIDVAAVKRNGWQQQHILVIAETDERLDMVEREFVRRIGNRLYGGKP